MRVVSILLSVVAVLLAAMIAVFFLGGALRVEKTVHTADAADAPEAFAAVGDVLESGLAPQTFAGADWTDAAGYALVDVNVTFRNAGLFAAEWLHAEVVPAAGDVAVYSQSADVLDVAARSSAELNLKLLVQRDAPGAGRTLSVEYYVLGMRRTLSVPIG